MAKSKKTSRVEVGGHLGQIHFIENGGLAYELRIDREGRWFHEGIEVVRDDIRNFFSQHLVRGSGDGYYVRIGDDECPVVVEDAPLVVVRVTRELPAGETGNSTVAGNLHLLLNDGGIEPLDPETLTFKNSNVPYCLVRSDIEARFSRPAYYQLTEFVEYISSENAYYLVLDGQSTRLRISEGKER